MSSAAPATMTDRERVRRILHYEPVDRIPVVHFGFWTDTVQKWAAEGRIRQAAADGWGDGNEADREIAGALGFDFNWLTCAHMHCHLDPPFERRIIRVLDDGSRHVMNHEGVVELERDGAGSIHAEIEHTLVDRASWEEHFKPRLRFDPRRVDNAPVPTPKGYLPLAKGGAEYLSDPDRAEPCGLHLGSLIGHLRNFAGVVGLSYLAVDDEELVDEMVDTIGGLSMACAERAFATGAKFDFVHFWEDICFKNGPLVTPAFFAEKIVPHYKRLTDLARAHGVDIASVDSDGMIDALVPLWLEGGVNTMFPIEVGTWRASIAPWREAHGRELRGVGGMDKTAFAHGRDAVDAEIERLRPLVEMGGFIPCPDHRLAPDADWDTVKYYCARMREVFGG